MIIARQFQLESGILHPEPGGQPQPSLLACPVTSPTTLTDLTDSVIVPELLSDAYMPTI